MFRLSKAETFKYPVRVKVPGDKGLQVVEFVGEFKRFNQEQVREIFNGTKRDRELLDKVWTGWTGVKTMVERNGVEVEEDLPVTPANREALLLEPGVEVALVNAWLDAAVYGPAKN